MQRIVINPRERGCSVQWTNTVRLTAVPRLSLEDGLLYTMSKNRSGRYFYTTMDATTGELLSKTASGRVRSNTLQMVGTIAPDGVLYQGTITGFVTVTAGSP